MAAIPPRRHDSPAFSARRGLLRGPSAGIREWTAFAFDVLNRIIDARLRLHGASPSKSANRYRVVLGAGTTVLVLTAIERLAGF